MRYEQIVGGFVREPWGGRYAPNATIVKNFGNHLRTITTDAEGLTFRARSGADPTRILFIGDSFTAGSEEGNYVHSFFEHFSRTSNRAVEAIGGGVEGYNGREIHNWFFNVGHRFAPDIVVYGFFFNDVLGYDNAVNWRISSGNPGLRITNPAIKDVFYWNGIHVPVPFKPNEFVKANSLVYGWLNRKWSPLQAYGLTARREWVIEHEPSLSAKEWSDLNDFFGRLNDIMAHQDARGGRFAIVLIPDGSEVAQPRGEGRYFREFKSFCAKHAIHCLTLLPTLRAARAKGEKVYYNFRDDADAHMTPRGYDIAGRAIAQWMRDTDFLSRQATADRPTGEDSPTGRAAPWLVTVSPYGNALLDQSIAGISLVIDRPPGGLSITLPLAAGEDAGLFLDGLATGPVVVRFRDDKSLVYLNARSGQTHYLLKPAHDNPELLIYADKPARFALRALRLKRADGRIFTAQWRDATQLMRQ